ncbi:6-carboxytetrahydropterin synthase [Marinimicrobium alkaliphilum]|uniref:6-carboxytetrahydropterin synthase n=1 Tax=Marinimicrobium alkaliphilum TaxID=2202654 RepID=UPI000DB99F43|nr:6-carboxytetrahydropterin synthase [Marinimicrobium alkaliphilum]
MLLFVDNLTNVDFSFLDPERGLLGETWLANIRLHGELDDQGMVCDFGLVKKRVRQWLDTELDHRLAIPVHAPNLHIREDGDLLDITWTFGRDEQQLHTRSPRSAIALVDADVLTPESVARWAVSNLKALFPDSVARLELDFVSEVIDGASYHYSHGLKKHAGNCQRIAHGHRSRLHIWADGERSQMLEQLWAERWRDIYIGSLDDLVEQTQVAGVDVCRFAYQASQGDFELTLPARCCYLIETDSTVELLAWHIAQRSRAEHPEHSVRVQAFEGVNKGAVAEA